MTQKSKKRRPGIKLRVFICFAVFTAVIIALLWLSESVFLGDIYKNIKASRTGEAAEKFTEMFEDGSFSEDKTDEISRRYTTCVLVIQMEDERPMKIVTSRHVETGCDIHASDGSPDTFIFGYYQSLYDEAKENGGSAEVRFGDMIYDPMTGNYELTEATKDTGESMIYVRLAGNTSGRHYMIILNSVISPLGSTVAVLSRILTAVSILIIVLAALLAFWLSRRISKPITELNKEAAKLAGGNYDATFRGGGYREVDELADTLNYAEAELGKTDRYRRELIANISHDLRTPITMIGGYAEAMRDIPGEDTKENLQIIIDESARLSTLVDEVLDISKLQSGVGNFEPEVFSLRESTEKTIERVRAFTAHEGYTVGYTCEEGDFPVYADRTRIEQAVYNLIGNALSYTGEDKKIDIRLGYTEDGKECRLDVSDSGAGIPKESLEDIWERYYKVPGHSRPVIGTGLGLSIVGEIVRISGGKCFVVSEEGKGSVFSVTLPLYVGENPKD